MAAEGWYDGTWNDWRWKTPDHRSSSISSIPQAGWTLHAWGRPSWRQWNSLVDTTSSDPRQYGGERAEVIPSLHEVVATVGGRLVGPPRRRNRRTVSRWALETAEVSIRQHLRRRLRRRKSMGTNFRGMQAARGVLCPRVGTRGRESGSLDDHFTTARAETPMCTR